MMIVKETIVDSWEELRTSVVALNTLRMRYTIEPHYTTQGLLAMQKVTKYKITIFADESEEKGED